MAESINKMELYITSLRSSVVIKQHLTDALHLLEEIEDLISLEEEKVRIANAQAHINQIIKEMRIEHL